MKLTHFKTLGLTLLATMILTLTGCDKNGTPNQYGGLVAPAPVDPAPVDPAPVDSAPVDSAPVLPTVVPVLDTTPPVLTLNGDNNVTINQGETYTEENATAIDNIDVIVPVVIRGTVDTDTVGVYILTYTSTDNSANEASVTRIVNVVTSFVENTGILDDTFDGDGIAKPYAAGIDEGKDVAIDNHHNIYVAGFSNNGTDDDIVIWKYESNGTLDSSFGTDGIVTYDSGFNEKAYSLALDGNGNIYVTGNSFNGTNNDLVILKYNSNGTLNQGFGTGGIVSYDGAKSDFAFDLTLDENGKIYVAGYSHSHSSTGDRDTMILKYNSNGTLVQDFGTDGVVIQDLGTDDHAESIVLDSSGNIYVTGTDGFSMMILKYDNNGTLVEDFGTGGIAQYHNRSLGYSIALDSTNNIYVSGWTFNNNSNYDMSLWKYDSDGILDTDFGIGGVVFYDNSVTREYGYDLVLDPIGNIYVTGLYNVDPDWSPHIMTWKYDSDGVLVQGFGTGGIAQYYDSRGGRSIGYGLALDSAGELYVTGVSYYNDMLLLNYK